MARHVDRHIGSLASDGGDGDDGGGGGGGGDDNDDDALSLSSVTAS